MKNNGNYWLIPIDRLSVWSVDWAPGRYKHVRKLSPIFTQCTPLNRSNTLKSQQQPISRTEAGQKPRRARKQKRSFEKSRRLKRPGLEYLYRSYYQFWTHSRWHDEKNYVFFTKFFHNVFFRRVFSQSFQVFLYNASKKFLAKCLKILKFTERFKLCDLEMPAQARKKSKIAPCLLGAL